MGYKREFVKIMGMPPEKLEFLLNIKMDYAEGNIPSGEMIAAFVNGKRIIHLGSEMLSSTRKRNELYYDCERMNFINNNPNDSYTPPNAEIINIEHIGMLNDQIYYSTPTSLMRKIFKQDGVPYAYEDLLGNIYFANFCYAENGSNIREKSKEFFFLVLAECGFDLRGVEELEIKTLVDRLLTIDADIVTHVEVTTEFNKEKFVKEAKDMLGAQREKFNAMMIGKERMITRRLEIERTAMEKRIRMALKAANHHSALVRPPYVVESI